MAGQRKVKKPTKWVQLEETKSLCELWRFAHAQGKSFAEAIEEAIRFRINGGGNPPK
jgi:hypothetical protein